MRSFGQAIEVAQTLQRYAIALRDIGQGVALRNHVLARRKQAFHGAGVVRSSVLDPQNCVRDGLLAQRIAEVSFLARVGDVGGLYQDGWNIG